MITRKHSFQKILNEYNEEFKCSHKIPPTLYNVNITHTTTGIFRVKFTNKGKLDKYEESLYRFLYYRISEYISESRFQQLIISKEEDALNLKIEIWPPNKIRYAYLYTNYFMKDVGHLGKSCMRTKEMQKSLNFYIKNNVRIVAVVGNNNKIHARALLWNDVKSSHTKKVFTYLDRVYTRSNNFLPLFDKLVNENNWQQYASTSAGEARSGLYIKNLDIKGITHLPYTDTFRYLYYKDNIITSSNLSKLKYHNYLHLTNTNAGGYFPELDPNRTIEVLTGEFISKKDATFVKRYDGYVLNKHIANIGGDYYSTRDNKVTKTELDGYILRKDSVNEVITNNPISEPLAEYSTKYNGYIHKSNILEINGDIYHKKDVDIVYFNRKWYHISQCFINYDRKKRNIAISKQKFHSWIDSEIFTPYPDSFVIKRGNLIPKKHTAIAYDVVYNPVLNDIEYQEVYCINQDGLIQLATGELIVNSGTNRKYLKKFNNKYYIKQEFELPNKNQLLLFK